MGDDDRQADQRRTHRSADEIVVYVGEVDVVPEAGVLRQTDEALLVHGIVTGVEVPGIRIGVAMRVRPAALID